MNNTNLTNTIFNNASYNIDPLMNYGKYCIDMTSDNINEIKNLMLSNLFNKAFNMFFIYLTISFIFLNIFAYFKHKNKTDIANKLFTVYLIISFLAFIFSNYVLMFNKVSYIILAFDFIMFMVFFYSIIKSSEHSMNKISEYILKFIRGFKYEKE